ncbi:hypothetical protein D1614_15025 [Maribellus luteus]|uniref:Uncharacterized protein n=1 Tax=Maribellus luteus TaxID=2305463 RepID=A0A399T0B1_9BACT|nr:hypothetical protein D1614_15025 [Maribellus luteus]
MLLLQPNHLRKKKLKFIFILFKIILLEILQMISSTCLGHHGKKPKEQKRNLSEIIIVELKKIFPANTNIPLSVKD